MKNKRYTFTVLALALSFSQTPPVTVLAEKQDAEDLTHTINEQIQETGAEDPEQETIIVRSIFLESEKDIDLSSPDDNAVRITEKEYTADLNSEICADYNLRAPETDEFAVEHEGAILNGDHYRLAKIIVSGREDAFNLSDKIEAVYKKTDTEPDSLKITFVYVFTQPRHLVTIHYEDIDTGEELFEPEVQKHPGSSALKGPAAYDVKEFIKIHFDGYRFRGISGDPLTGDVDSDKNIHILYEKEN